MFPERVVTTTVHVVTTTRCTAGAILCFGDFHPWIGSAVGGVLTASVTLLLAVMAFHGANQTKSAERSAGAYLLSLAVGRGTAAVSAWLRAAEAPTSVQSMFEDNLGDISLVADLERCIRELEAVDISKAGGLMHIRAEAISVVQAALDAARRLSTKGYFTEGVSGLIDSQVPLLVTERRLLSAVDHSWMRRQKRRNLAAYRPAESVR